MKRTSPFRWTASCISFLFVFVFAFSTQSCQRDTNPLVEQRTSIQFTVEQVRADYERQLANQKSSKTTKNKSEKTTRKKLDWSSHYFVGRNGEPRMVVPFRLADELYAQMPDGNKVAYSDLTWFVVSQNKGKYEYEIVTRYPDLDWQKGKNQGFTGKIIIEDINGDFVKGFEYQGEKIRSILPDTENGRTLFKVCSYVDWYSCGVINGQLTACQYMHTDEVGCTEVQDLDQDKFSYADGKWYANFGGCQGCWGTTVIATNVAPGPGDRLCSSTFNYPSNSSFYITNVHHMRFEDGVNFNEDNKPMIYSLTNGISEGAMNSKPINDYFGQRKSCLQYMHDIFPGLWVTNDIKWVTEPTGKYLQVTPFAAQRISAYVSAMASIGVRAAVPYSSLPGNEMAWTEFAAQTTNMIKSLLPGSKIYRGLVGNGTTSNAIYAPTCF